MQILPSSGFTLLSGPRDTVAGYLRLGLVGFTNGSTSGDTRTVNRSASRRAPSARLSEYRHRWHASRISYTPANGGVERSTGQDFSIHPALTISWYSRNRLSRIADTSPEWFHFTFRPSGYGRGIPSARSRSVNRSASRQAPSARFSEDRHRWLAPRISYTPADGGVERSTGQDFSIHPAQGCPGTPNGGP